MIEEHWGLARKPFANTPDPRFVFHSSVFQEAFARLTYDVTELRGGLSLVTGDIGCGKTMLAQTLRETLQGTRHDVICLPYPRLTAIQLLQAVASAAGMAKAPRSKAALVTALGRHLAEVHACSRRPVLIVDEAQLAAPGVLEELRLLTNFEDREDKHLHVLLLGQPELRERIASRPQIDQRIGLRFHLSPLEDVEVSAYVRHRLQVAESRRELFAPAAVEVLADRSGGVPRLINNLATQALFVGAMRGISSIDAALIADVADDQS